MNENEAWGFLESGHTGILTTLRRDGWPVALPVWFAIADRRIYVGTPSQTKKLQRVSNDERASFLVEKGTRWAELAAVHLPVLARVLDPERDAEEMRRAGRLLVEKYASLRTAPESLPSASSRHYSSQRVIRLDAAAPLVSWDNARLRLDEDAVDERH